MRLGAVPKKRNGFPFLEDGSQKNGRFLGWEGNASNTYTKMIPDGGMHDAYSDVGQEGQAGASAGKAAERFDFGAGQYS